MKQREKLFDQFPPVSAEQWVDRIKEDLRGADFEKRMIWRTAEGFDIYPFYRTTDIENLKHSATIPGRFPFVRGGKTENNNWHVRQDITVSDFSVGNRKALDILMKGVDSLGFVITQPESVTHNNLRALLKNIYIDIVELNFRSKGKAMEILEALKEISDERVLPSGALKGAIEADPLGQLMLNGRLCVTPEEGFDYLASLTRLSFSYQNLKTVHVNASVFGNAGAGVTLELALALSAGSEYMVQLTGRDVSAEKAASKIKFTFSTGPDYFSGIAGLRAARLLWSVIQKGFIEDENDISRMEIHCITGRWNKTIYDPYVNMLRTQTEAMSAVLGGTDSLTVEPFDLVFREPGEFSERIARNQQLILREEAYFDKVADPAAGSYYIENLTSLIAEKAWQIFLEIEEQGGFLECLKSGLIQKKLGESAKARKKALSVKKEVALGTNQYPDNDERISADFDGRKEFSPVKDEEGMVIKPVKLARGTEEFEKIRMAVDRSPHRPVVFLLPVGNVVMRRARAQFSANFFGSAGYRVIDNHGFDTAAEGVKKAVESHADLVVICSSDEEYPLFAPDIFRELKGTSTLVVAGNPPCAGELRKIGVENFIYAGLNMTDTLRIYNEKMGIEMKLEHDDYEAEI
jgi:methylmalonyl-CoA mutase